MNDMTTGSPFKQILWFTIPVFLGNLFQCFYSLADSAIVGRYLGVDALAAVGATATIVYLVTFLAIGLTGGFGMRIAQSFGAKDMPKLRHYLAMSGYLCTGIVLVLTAGTLLFNHAILQVLNTQAEIYDQVYIYIAIIYAGLPATMLYNMLASIARALGDSKTPLFFLVVSSVINIVLDVILVGFTPMGVAGAASATVIAQLISGIACAIYLYYRYPTIRCTAADAKWSWKSCGELLAVGVPMALQYSVIGIGGMIFQSFLNQMDAVYIATWSTSKKVQGMIQQTYLSLGAALANYVGQNYGARNSKRVRQGVSVTIKIALVLSVFLILFGYFVAPSIVGLFVENPTEQMLEIARQSFYLTIWFYPIHVMVSIFSSALQGMGKGFATMLSGIAELIGRSLMMILLFPTMQYVIACLQDPFAWACALIVLAPFYFYFIRVLGREQENETQSEVPCGDASC